MQRWHYDNETGLIFLKSGVSNDFTVFQENDTDYNEFNSGEISNLCMSCSWILPGKPELMRLIQCNETDTSQQFNLDRKSGRLYNRNVGERGENKEFCVQTMGRKQYLVYGPCQFSSFGSVFENERSMAQSSVEIQSFKVAGNSIDFQPRSRNDRRGPHTSAKNNCGIPPSSGATTLEQNPWNCAVVVGNKTCSGTVISENYVVTTADCVSGEAILNVRVVAGHANVKVGSDSYALKEIIVHGLYKDASILYNVAILKLENSFQLSSSIYPICLPSENYCLDEKSRITISSVKQGQLISDLSILSENYDCLSKNPNDFLLDEMACVKQNDCDEFSAGSSVSHLNNGVFTLFGILGNGKSFGDCQESAVSTVLRISTHLNWIFHETGLEGRDDSVKFCGEDYYDAIGARFLELGAGDFESNDDGTDFKFAELNIEEPKIKKRRGGLFKKLENVQNSKITENSVKHFKKPLNEDVELISYITLGNHVVSHGETQAKIQGWVSVDQKLSVKNHFKNNHTEIEIYENAFPLAGINRKISFLKDCKTTARLGKKLGEFENSQFSGEGLSFEDLAYATARFSIHQNGKDVYFCTTLVPTNAKYTFFKFDLGTKNEQLVVFDVVNEIALVNVESDVFGSDKLCEEQNNEPPTENIWQSKPATKDYWKTVRNMGKTESLLLIDDLGQKTCYRDFKNGPLGQA